MENVSVPYHGKPLENSKGGRTVVIGIQSKTSTISPVDLSKKAFSGRISPSRKSGCQDKAWGGLLFGLDPGPEEFQQVVRGAEELPF